MLSLIARYGVPAQGDIRLIDSSRGADDIRLNYVVGRRWVLWLCNAPDMTERRLAELDRLIGRYREFGLLCPSFVTGPDGRYLSDRNGLSCYLSEYIDLPTAQELDLSVEEKEALRQEVLRSVAGFAQRFRGADLSDTMGMYSLFDLNLFDKPVGKDEKQQNFESLCGALREHGETVLAGRLEEKHARIRAKLKAVYRSLPRCVFQGDENFSNLLLDGDRHLAGLIDFNPAGTEVVVNQFANLGAGFDEEIRVPIGARTRLEHALDACARDRELLLGVYSASREEKQAMEWYTRIALAAGWPQVCFFLWGLKNDALREETTQLLGHLAGGLLE